MPYPYILSGKTARSPDRRTSSIISFAVSSGQACHRQATIPHIIGEEKEVNVTFPEDYQAAELAGKPAVFKCTVKKIEVKELPELDDEFAKDVSEFDTLEEYKADIKKNLEEKKADAAKRAKEDAAVDAAVANATMEIPDAMLDTQVNQMIDDFARRMQSQGLSMEQYFQFTGQSVDKMMEDMKPQALKRIQSRLVLELSLIHISEPTRP